MHDCLCLRRRRVGGWRRSCAVSDRYKSEVGAWLLILSVIEPTDEITDYMKEKPVVPQLVKCNIIPFTRSVQVNSCPHVNKPFAIFQSPTCQKSVTCVTSILNE